MIQRLIVVLIVLSMSGCAGASSEGSPPFGDVGTTSVGNGILEGSIVDESFVPIQAAVVRLEGTDHRMETTLNGHFRFTDLEPKLYRIRVDAAGWSPATIDGRVSADFATRLTIFLEPLADLAGYSTLQQLRGDLTCAEAENPATDQFTCELAYHNTNFPADWAAVLVEVQWGPSGHSSSTLAELTAEDVQAGALYADVVAERPARLLLRPNMLHDGLGGTHATPDEGVSAPLNIGIKKDPSRVASSVGAGVTFQESYQMYITTFYHEVPADVDEYTALPQA